MIIYRNKSIQSFSKNVKLMSVAVGATLFFAADAVVADSANLNSSKYNNIEYGTGAKVEAIQGKNGLSAKGSIAVGWNAKASSTASIAAGYEAKTTNHAGTAIGYQAEAANYANALGYKAKAKGDFSNASGYEAEATAERATAIGPDSKAYGARSLSLGNDVKTHKERSFSIGSNINNQGTHTTVIGSNIGVSADNSVILGHESAYTERSDSTGALVISAVILRRLMQKAYCRSEIVAMSVVSKMWRRGWCLKRRPMPLTVANCMRQTKESSISIKS